MNKKPLVSGIMIFLNAEKFIEEAIESVFAQTYDNWELLLVDDGSTDGSTAIAQRYAAQYSEKVRYLEHEGHQNRGMSATRNLGIRNAKGEYIAFLDADDVWLPQKLERQVAILESNSEAAVVSGPTQYWYSWTGNPEDSQRDSLREIGVQPNQLFKPPMLLSLLLQNEVKAPATCSVLIRREVFEKTGGFEESFRGMFEDRAFFAKVYLKVPVYITDEHWDRYRQHPDSTCYIAEKTGIYNPAGISSAHLTFLNWITEYLSQQGVEDAKVRQALQKGLLPYHHPVLFSFLRTKYHLKLKLIDLFKSIAQSKLLIRVRLWLEDNIRSMILRKTVKHISGLERINYAMNELIVLCLVRNGELYIKSFIEHYLGLGVKHIVFLDNGSTDETIAIARNYEKVTILQTHCPYRQYETVMKKYLVKRFSKNRWNLFVDIDELFDYPHSDVLDLASLLTYLNNNSFTAVVAQMLDLFSDKSLAELKSSKDDNIKEIYPYYDLSSIEKKNYSYGTVQNKAVKMYWGGIRKSLFGTNNGLTKAALTFVDNQIKLFRSFHHVENACIADFTCVLRHYPFVSTFYEKVLEAVQTDRYKVSASHEYKMYWEKLKQNPALTLKTETTEKLEDVNCLVENQFLVVSDDYLQWVDSHIKNSAYHKTTNEKLMVSPG